MIRIDQIQAGLVRVVTPTLQVWFSHEYPIAYARKGEAVVLRDPGVSTTRRRHQRLIDSARVADTVSDINFSLSLTELTAGA
jgi:hypothetical protein